MVGFSGQCQNLIFWCQIWRTGVHCFSTRISSGQCQNPLQLTATHGPLRDATLLASLALVSHHPLAIAELEKEQIQVMWRDEGGQVRATEPAYSPRGMGYAGILTSDMFGLYTTLDAPTEDLIRQRRTLAEKIELDEAEKLLLRKLDQELAILGLSSRHWDGDYQQYLQIRSELETERERGTASDNPDVHMPRRANRIVVRQFAICGHVHLGWNDAAFFHFKSPSGPKKICTAVTYTGVGCGVILDCRIWPQCHFELKQCQNDVASVAQFSCYRSQVR
jgi:hypothetical protein